MAKAFARHILLTGAGFTKNFGGFLAKEMWHKIFKDQRIQRSKLIRELLTNDFDYESVYHKIINGDYADEDKGVINDVIFEVYGSLDEICRNWRQDSQYPSIGDVNSILLKHFSGNANEIGFFFTLNQDLFVERYVDPRPQLIHPGVSELQIDKWAPFTKDGFVTLPTADKLNRNLQHSRLNYVKLHGSYGWLSSNGSNGYVIGEDKEDQIHREKLLLWYLGLFKDVLSTPTRRLLLVGYGFRDRHINKIIADAVASSDLGLFVISPTEEEHFISILRSTEEGDTLLQGLKGYFPYTLLDIFPSSKPESQAWKEVRRCYFGQ